MKWRSSEFVTGQPETAAADASFDRIPKTNASPPAIAPAVRVLTILAAFALACAEPPATAPTPAEAVPIATSLSQTMMEVKRVMALMADLELYRQSTRQRMQESTERLRTTAC